MPHQSLTRYQCQLLNELHQKRTVRFPPPISPSSERTGDVRFRGRQEHYARETIARLIIGYASAGERDPFVLSREALRTMNAL